MRRSLLLLAVLSLTIHYSDRAVAQNLYPKAQPQLGTENRNQSDRIETARKLYQQGLALTEARQFAQAAESFQQATQFDPEFADAYAALGRTYFKMREWQKAIDNLNRAAALNSKQRDAGKSVLQNTGLTIQVKPAQPGNAAATNPALKVSNHYWVTRKNAEISTFNESIASTVSLRELRPLMSVPSEEVKSAAVSRDAESPVVEQTAQGARVSQPVTPTPSVNATSSTEVLPSTRTEETSLTKIYRVGANDVLDVRLNYGPEQQSTLFTVTAAGLLEHPLLNEPMPVAGLTVEEIGSRIEEDLRKRAIVETPKALVGVRDYASHSVLVSGLVKESGTKFIRREAIPLYVVVADAQPLLEAARVTVVRGGDQNQIHEIDLNQAADMNFLVRSGDVITLNPNATQFIYIGGEVKLPGEKTFRRGLTLMQVVLASGGLGPKAKIAEIARNNEAGYLVPTRYTLKEITTGKVVDPVLKPGDRISILR